MRTKWVVCVVLAMFLASVAAPAVAGQGDKIVRTKALDGLPIMTADCKLLGCTVLLSLDTTPGSTAPSSLFLVRGLVDSVLTLTLSLLGLAAVEPDRPVAVAQDASWTSSQSSAAVLDELWNRVPVSYYGTTAWEGYLQQPANDIVRLRDTHCGLRETGAGIVAVIDTGGDPDHPPPKPLPVGGHDFPPNPGGGNQTPGTPVQQSPAPGLDGGYARDASPPA